ncbi:ABC transporter permease [Virgisporangium ochraceum]|uniref:Transporter n=1 Tax=Virgisporangium ochraceum TaxID=65505 RepID=A0A8J3ZRX6_9ACTN|nr:hypothetical protein [Virgisporangium ochraceum]GIJ67215.1 transporter [Virgisporangium ochraceum]
MLWVTWRQHRSELLVAALLLAAVAVPVLVTGVDMHHRYVADGVSACAHAATPADRCEAVVSAFLNRYTEWGNRFAWVALLPGLAGVFVGAPMLGREFETGTWRLAFTQSVTRLRWLAGRLAVVAVGVAAVSLAFALLFTWWRAPLDELGGRLRTASFVVSAPSLVAASLFALALGAFAGAVLRRVVVAMAVTLGGFFAVRITMEEQARPGYLTPRVRVTDPMTDPGTAGLTDTDWSVGAGWIDAAGHRVSSAEEAAIIDRVFGDSAGAVHGAGSPLEKYLAENGLRHYTEYHPDSSFWAMQAVDSAWFLGFAAVLVVATGLVVRLR